MNTGKEISVVNKDELKAHKIAEGFEARFINLDKMTMAYWEIKGGLPYPDHEHPHEQMSYILEGELEFEMYGERKVLKAGDFVLIPSGVAHGGRSITDSKLIDVFSPIREDFKKLSESSEG